METHRIQEDAQGGPAVPGHSQVTPGSKHKRERSPAGSTGSRHQERGKGEEKIMTRTSPTSHSAKDKPDSTRAGGHRRGGTGHGVWRPSDRRNGPRSPRTTTGPRRRPEVPEHRPSSPKRRRRLFPEARVSMSTPLSRVFNHLGGLQVGLAELRAPGGAFLPGPRSDHREPTAEQRAWLSWQLGHSGAALHCAFATLQALLAGQPCQAGPPPSAPAPGWPPLAPSRERSRLLQGPSPEPQRELKLSPANSQRSAPQQVAWGKPGSLQQPGEPK
nr:uncharacterized protein LOC105873740 [Microcebus murinus]